VLLLWGVPRLLLEQRVPDFVSAFARFGLPWTLLLLVFLPKPQAHAEGQVFDFFYAVLVLQLGLVLVLGPLASMRFTGEQYFAAVFVTVSGFGIALFVLAVLWSPLRGFGGLRTYFSRYLLSVGMPFELWMRRIAELAETEPDSRRFLELSLEELAQLPWVVGGRWRSPDGEGVFGKPEGVPSTFSQQGLELVVHTRHALSPALTLHIRLLARVIGQLYEAKRREVAMRHSAYLQATHETGARLTHDVKNLLQSLYALMSAAPHGAADDGYTQLLQRQVPQLTQRLNATLEKLRAPASATTELLMPAREWWATIERRFVDSGVKLEGAIEGDPSIPAPLFDSFVENGLENARAKAARDPGIEIAVKFLAKAGDLELEVRDTGTPLPAANAERVFRQPIERDGGLGIGLYHIARQAADAGYRAELASNADGDVRFRLSLDR
jgi:signal transduction histidine kinase